MKRILLLGLSMICGIIAFAGDFHLGSGFSDGMVIQQNKPLTVWGWGEKGTTVSIKGDWMADEVTVTVDQAGYFSGLVAVPAVKAGDYAAHTLAVSSKGVHIVVTDVLIGEVWLCSGQSNMQFAMKTVIDSTSEIAAANHPHLRLLDVGLNFSATPIDSFSGHWVHCTPETVKKFSAVGYYMGRELMQTLDVPVGVIFSGIGASAAQAYVPQPSLAADTMLNRIYLQPYLESPKSKEKIDGGFSFEKVTRPFLLYNAVIYPLRRISLRGICWYQGESNHDDMRAGYTHLTQTMIQCWRELFAQGELPFYYVQVAPYHWDKKEPGLADYSFFREAQGKIAGLGNTAMVTPADLGESHDLHPHNKKLIGIRLAKTALNRVYGRLDIAWRGPVFQHLSIEGRKAVLYFEPGTAEGLRADGVSSRVFTIAGEDRVFYPAAAVIEGDRIVVSSKSVKKPVAVRYAFWNDAVVDIHNGAGWPIIPFRTDDWIETPIIAK